MMPIKWKFYRINVHSIKKDTCGFYQFVTKKYFLETLGTEPPGMSITVEWTPHRTPICLTRHRGSGLGPSSTGSVELYWSRGPSHTTTETETDRIHGDSPEPSV